MEFAIKLCAFVLYHLYIVDIIEAQKLCKVPNGEAGTCIQISRCGPLLDLYKKKYKTSHENMYLQQSFCGAPGAVKVKVCCPSPSLWNRFVASPVVYPATAPIRPSVTPTPITNSPIFTNSKTPTPTEASRPAVPLLIPPSEILESRIVPEDKEKKREEEKKIEEEIKQECGIDKSNSNKIIGGEAVQIDQYPWLALLQYSGDVLDCGGSLITHRFVLTAAHCLNGINGPPLYVRLAEYNTSSYPTDYVEVDGGGMDSITVDIVEVKSIHVHPHASRDQKFNDIGLIELIRDINTSGDFIKVICLPEKNFTSEFSPSTNFTVAGWGITGFGKKSSEVKLQVSVPYVPIEQCKGRDAIGMETQICAGGVEGKDSCNGDSGGPLMYVHDEKYYIVGVVSYGPKYCGTKSRPATHTNVFTYMPWIKQIIWSTTSKD